MRLVTKIASEEFPIGRALVEVEAGDRVLSMVTDEKGRFSVPISFANPISNYVFVLYPDSKQKSNRLKDVTVPGTTYSRWSKLIYDKQNDDYRLEAINNFSVINFFPSAYAQNLFQNDPSIQRIDGDVLNSISKVTGRDQNSIPLDSKLQTDLNLGNIELSYLNHILSSKYGVKIWDELWRESNTVEDVVKLAYRDYYDNVLNQGYSQNRFNTSEDLLVWTRENYSHDIVSQFNSAQLMIGSGYYDGAAKTLSPMLESNPSFYPGWLSLATALRAQDKGNEAELAYGKALESAEEFAFIDVGVYSKYANFLFDKERYAEARNLYEKALEIEPDSLGFRNQLIQITIESDTL